MASTSGGSITRSKTDVWLVGQTLPALLQTKLPSIKEVLQLFFYHKIERKQTVSASAEFTALEVLAVWEKASIPTRKKQHVKEKILKYFNQWQSLKKNKENKKKRSESMQDKEKTWQITLEELFDIAHANALETMKIEEDKKFLLAQRQNRSGKIGTLDKRHAKKVLEKQGREDRLKSLQQREEEGLKRLTEKCLLASSSTSPSLTGSSDDETCVVSQEPGPSTSGAPPAKRARKNLIDDRLAVSLDVAKLSDRKAAVVLTSALKSAKCDPEKYNINKSSIRRQRIQHREKIAQCLKSEFKPEVPLTAHWDGKMCEDITGHEIVDRLPILVSGQGVDQLLGVPKLSRGTGDAIATAVFETIMSWNLREKVKCMSFDTTASNTGHRNGACILLEQKLEKDLLWLACRHHILEMTLEAVVLLSLGPSSGPDILIFKRFKNSWTNINQEHFKSVSTDTSLFKDCESISDYIISFAKDQLTLYHPRDDYKELLQLIVIFLGGTFEKPITFRAPAGLHRARWMAKAIYSLKIFLFRDQFAMSKKELQGIKDICLFTVRVYAKYWYTAPSAASAPGNDLQLLKDLKMYERINEKISKAALKKIMGQLWYLSEELVGFAFFDDKIDIQTKKNMVKALNNEGLEYCPKRITLESDLVLHKNIEDFVSSNTYRFFRITGMSPDFLKTEVETWNNDDSYIRNKAIVQNMRVVNDIAERGVALMEEYNKLHTTNEDQKQYLLLLVKDYRKKFPDTKKSTLLST